MKTKLLLLLAALAFVNPFYAQSKDDDPTEEGKKDKKKSDIEHIEPN